MERISILIEEGKKWALVEKAAKEKKNITEKLNELIDKYLKGEIK